MLVLLFFFLSDGQPFLPMSELLFLFLVVSLKKVCEAGDCDWLWWLLMLPLMYLLWLKLFWFMFFFMPLLPMFSDGPITLTPPLA